MLRRAEDAYVDQLYDAAPAHGATLVAALFPRSYIDANRAADDLDPAILTRPLPPLAEAAAGVAGRAGAPPRPARHPDL